MFGYLLPYKPEMKVCEFECYRAVYCGLCKQLAKDYGFVSRMLLNYDMVLLVLLADGLSGQAGESVLQRCMVNPQKRCMLQKTQGLRLAADCTVLASHYKLLDDREDEQAAKSALAGCADTLLQKAVKKAVQRQPEIDAVLKKATAQQAKLEQAQSKSYDQAAEPTAQMTAAMFAACAVEQGQRMHLARMGMFLGKIIYFLDAAEDYQSDLQKGRYNVFVENQLSKQQAVEMAKQQCRMAAREAAISYGNLVWKLNKPIWDNILYLGVPYAIEQAGMPRTRLKKHPT